MSLVRSSGEKVSNLLIEKNLNSCEETTSTEFTMLEHLIDKEGIYLLTGYCLPNYMAQSGREIHVQILKNDELIQDLEYVYNMYIWTAACSISSVCRFEKNDKLTIKVTNMMDKKFSVKGGKLTIVKLSS